MEEKIVEQLNRIEEKLDKLIKQDIDKDEVKKVRDKYWEELGKFL